MLLALASGNTFLDLGDHSALGAVTTVSPDLATVAKQAFYDFGERPMWAERTTYGTGTLCLSPRFGRLDSMSPPRIDSIKKNGVEWVKDLGRKNVQDLLTMIQWNEDNVSQYNSPCSHHFDVRFIEYQVHATFLGDVPLRLAPQVRIHP